MNLIIRLLTASLFALFRPRIRLDGTLRTRGRTWPWDYDIQGHMTNTRYLALADIAIFEFMIQSGAARHFAKKRLFPVIIMREVKYKRMLRFPMRYTIHTRMAYWKDEYYCWHQVFEGSGKYTAEVYTLGVVLDRNTHEKIPPQLIAEEILGERVLSPEANETIANLVRRAQERPELDDALQPFYEGATNV